MPRNAITNWCLLRNNELLKQLIIAQMKEKKIKMGDLARLSDVPYDAIRHYMQGRIKGINQYNVIKIAAAVGIEVGLRVEFKTL